MFVAGDIARFRMPNYSIYGIIGHANTRDISSHEHPSNFIFLLSPHFHTRRIRLCTQNSTQKLTLGCGEYGLFLMYFYDAITCKNKKGVVGT